MNILIAPDSFKDCLSALEVAQNIETGIRRIKSFFGVLGDKKTAVIEMAAA